VVFPHVTAVALVVLARACGDKNCHHVRNRVVLERVSFHTGVKQDFYRRSPRSPRVVVLRSAGTSFWPQDEVVEKTELVS